MESQTKFADSIYFHAGETLAEASGNTFGGQAAARSSSGASGGALVG